MSNITNFNVNLKNLLKKNFETKNIEHIFGYGSGIFPQKDTKPKMIDLIFIVDNTEEFHNQNIIQNKNHYSKFALYLRPFLNYFNENGTRVYYNSSIVLDNSLNIKYGVISQRNFMNSLYYWNNLFVSGRFHKPVLSIYDNKKQISNENNGRKNIFSISIM